MIQPAQRLDDIGEYYFSKKLEEIRQMEARGLGPIISLGIGSPDLAPAPRVIEASERSLREKTSHGYSPYRSRPELRSAMAEWYQRDYGVKLSPATQILPLLGSKEGILYVSLAYLNPGDEALVPNPGYPAYSSVTRLIGATPRFYDLDEKNGWQPDWSALEKLDLSRCKLMWANYPQMPTGGRASRKLFDALVDFGRRKNILICHDNPYSRVLNDGPPQSILTSDPEMLVSLELNSLSKSFNMAGWRVGALFAAESVVNAVLQVKSNVDSGMFAPIQAGARVALALSEDWHEERNAIYRERREVVWSIFDRLRFQYDRNAVGMFVWAKAPDELPNVADLVDQLLVKAHVFLTPGMIFGSQGGRYARASLCAPIEKLREALHRVERFATEQEKS